MRRSLATVALLTLASVAMAPSPAAAAPARSGHNAVELSVMTFNIFYGGDELDFGTGDFCEVADGCDETFEAVVATVLASGADVVGLQEAERNTRRLAEALGWHYDERNHVISRFPLIDPPGADGVYAFVEVSPGRVVAIANLHLTSDPYGPYAVRDGASAGEVTDVGAVSSPTRDPAAARRVAGAPASGDSVVRHRRLQQPVVPRLDCSRRGRPPRRALRTVVAGHGDAGSRGPARLVSRRVSGPGCSARLHLDAGRAGVVAGGRGGAGSHRPRASDGRGDDDVQQDRRRVGWAGRGHRGGAVPIGSPRRGVDVLRSASFAATVRRRRTTTRVRGRAALGRRACA